MAQAVHDLRMDGGSATRFSESYPLLITDSCRNTHFYDEFWRENYPFLTVFCQFLENPRMFKETLLKKRPLFRDFWTQKPTHMGGTYPYPQHVLLPPPPLGSVESAQKILMDENLSLKISTVSDQQWPLCIE